MFTGLVQDVGRVASVEPGPTTALWIESRFDRYQHGESIACDGVCLTVVDQRPGAFKVQAAPETLRRATVGAWTSGRAVNLERALKVGDPLGGHWVQGHVDGVVTLLAVGTDGGARTLTLSLPAELAPTFVPKGSVCLDGVSLTLTHLGDGSFSVMLIPETLAKTTLGAKVVGDQLNVEADLVGKYVVRLVELGRLR